MRFAKLNKPPSLLSPPSKALEKNKPPGGLNRGFTVFQGRNLILLLSIQSGVRLIEVIKNIDCKTVRISAYSSNRERSNERSGTRLKTESETGFSSLASHVLRAYDARALRACNTLTPRFTDFLTDFGKKTRLFCSLLRI